MKTLVLDIETGPALGQMWGFWQQDISPKQVRAHPSILCWSAKWLGKKKVWFEWGFPYDLQGEYPIREKPMLEALLPLLDEADAVVGHNLKKFDIPRIRGRCLVHRLRIPSPYKEIDTLLIARAKLGFSGNSLEYLAEVLGCTPKGTHKRFPGWNLWAQCILNNKKAWKEMKTYNIQDIKTTEEIYMLIRPHAGTHPNFGIYAEANYPMCPDCGGTVKKDGFYRTNVGKYQQYQCRTDGCGGWAWTLPNLLDKDQRKVLLRNVVT